MGLLKFMVVLCCGTAVEQKQCHFIGFDGENPLCYLCELISFKCFMLIATVILNRGSVSSYLDFHSKAHLHEVATSFPIVRCLWEMTAKK